MSVFRVWDSVETAERARHLVEQFTDLVSYRQFRGKWYVRPYYGEWCQSCFSLGAFEVVTGFCQHCHGVFNKPLGWYLQIELHSSELKDRRKLRKLEYFQRLVDHEWLFNASIREGF
jgi:hypothetical protein